MKPQLTIRHTKIPWLKRIFSRTKDMAGIFLIIALGNYLVLSDDGSSIQDALPGIIMLSVLPPFIIYLIWHILKTKHYLMDVFSDGEKIKIRFLTRNKEQHKEWALDDIEVELRMISTFRIFGKNSAPNFEARLHTDEESFILQEDIAWKDEELHKLFVYVMEAKWESYNSEEKLSLSHLENKLGIKTVHHFR